MGELQAIDRCPVCRHEVWEGESYAACDHRGRTTGDYAEDIFDGTPQNHVGHAGCLTRVDPDPATV